MIMAGALILAISPLARAQKVPSKEEIQTARTLFAEATADEDAQKWEDALRKFTEAGAIKMTPGIRAHIALCNEKLGRLVAALAEYERAVEAARAEDNKKVLVVVEAGVAKLRERVPTLNVVVPERDGLEVLVKRGTGAAANDEQIPRSSEGYKLHVDPGDVAVTVRAPGFKTYQRTERVPEGKTVTLDVVLEREIEPSRPMATLPAAAPPPRRDEGFWTTRNTIGVIGVGVGVLALAGGAGVSLVNQGDARDVERLKGGLPSSSACSQPNPQVSQRCGEVRDATDARDSHASMAVGLYVAGAVVVGVTAAVWLLWPQKKRESSQVGRLIPVVDFASRSVGLQGAF